MGSRNKVEIHAQQIGGTLTGDGATIHVHGGLFHEAKAVQHPLSNAERQGLQDLLRDLNSLHRDFSARSIDDSDFLLYVRRMEEEASKAAPDRASLRRDLACTHDKLKSFLSSVSSNLVAGSVATLILHQLLPRVIEILIKLGN